MTATPTTIAGQHGDGGESIAPAQNGGRTMSSRVVSAEVRAQLGRRLIRPRAFAARAGIAHKKALAMLHDQRDWCLEDVEAAADALGVEPLSLIFPPVVGVGTDLPVPWTEGLAPASWRTTLGEILALDKA